MSPEPRRQGHWEEQEPWVASGGRGSTGEGGHRHRKHFAPDQTSSSPAAHTQSPGLHSPPAPLAPTEVRAGPGGTALTATLQLALLPLNSCVTQTPSQKRPLYSCLSLTASTGVKEGLEILPTWTIILSSLNNVIRSTSIEDSQ